MILIKLIGSKLYASKTSLLETRKALIKLSKKGTEISYQTQALQNSVKNKNNVYPKFVKCKSQNLKEFYQNNYKTYRSLSSKLYPENTSLTFSMRTLKILEKL